MNSVASGFSRPGRSRHRRCRGEFRPDWPSAGCRFRPAEGRPRGLQCQSLYGRLLCRPPAISGGIKMVECKLALRQKLTVILFFRDRAYTLLMSGVSRKIFRTLSSSLLLLRQAGQCPIQPHRQLLNTAGASCRTPLQLVFRY